MIQIVSYLLLLRHVPINTTKMIKGSILDNGANCYGRNFKKGRFITVATAEIV